MENNKEILKVCMSKGFLLDKEMLGVFSQIEDEDAREIIDKVGALGLEERMINRDLFCKNIERIREMLVDDRMKQILEDYFLNVCPMVRKERNRDEEKENIKEMAAGGDRGVKVLSAPIFPPKKVSVLDFVKHFRNRYEVIKQVLMSRDFDDLTSIRKIGDSRDNYTIIAAVMDKRFTKNKNLFLEVEDLTGSSIVLINQNKKELFEKAKDILVDDIVAFRVSGSKEMLFANDVIFPDSGLEEKKHLDEEKLIAFSSDFHIGSNMFLEKNFLKFIKWLNGEEGDEKQREMAKKIKYLFVTGDSVDGVGIFPGQDKVLSIKDIKKQYDKLVELLKLIRDDVTIIIAPGQHDAVWVGEPQPIIGEEWAEGLHEMKNVVLVTNPALVEIEGGFRILMYHGASMHGIIEEIPELRLKYGHDSPTRVVKEMLKRRHLGAMHGSTDYIPCENEDPMVIKQVPDILATGDQHRAEVSMHNNILLVASSCWQSITPFEEKVGNNPDPCKVPIFNMKTREIKIIDFSDEDSYKTYEQRIAEGIKEKQEGEAEKIREKIGVKNG